jgi:hypothetical protein
MGSRMGALGVYGSPTDMEVFEDSKIRSFHLRTLLLRLKVGKNLSKPTRFPDRPLGVLQPARISFRPSIYPPIYPLHELQDSEIKFRASKNSWESCG